MEAGQSDAAIASYREALKDNPKNLQAANGLSDALTAKGIDASGPTNSEAGDQYLEEAVKLDPKNEVAFAKLGEIFVAGEQTERGIGYYEKAVAANPAFTDAFVPLGIAYLKVGNVAKAEEYSAKADAAGAGSADAAYLRGMILFKQNKNQEALAAFQKTLTIDQPMRPLDITRPRLYDRLNQSDQSIASYKKTVEDDPTFTSGVASTSASLITTPGDYNNAANAYEQSVKYDPNNAQGHANLASAYRQEQKYPEANAQYKQAEDLGMKNDPNLYNEWGYCLGKTNEWDQSEARLKESSELGHSAVDDSNVGLGILQRR